MPPPTDARDARLLASILNQNLMVTLEILASKWMGELVAALPIRWQDRLGPKRWRILDDELVSSRSEHSKRQPIAIAVPPEDYLVHRIELPLASRFQVANLMQFEAPRHVPLPLEQACLDFRIVHNDISASRTIVELAIIRRESYHAPCRANAGIAASAVTDSLRGELSDVPQ